MIIVPRGMSDRGATIGCMTNSDLESLSSADLLTATRVLVHKSVLAEAAGKSKRQIEELVARLAPEPPVPAVIRKLPERATLALPPPPSVAFSVLTSAALAPTLAAPPPRPVQGDEHRPVIRPLTEDTFKVQFTASRAFRDKLRHAQDLLRHQVAAHSGFVQAHRLRT